MEGYHTILFLLIFFQYDGSSASTVYHLVEFFLIIGIISLRWLPLNCFFGFNGNYVLLMTA